MERFAARAIVLLMSAVGQVFEPDRPHESLHVLGRRPKTETLVTGLCGRRGVARHRLLTGRGMLWLGWFGV
jgi:hypothetical protein